jgi:hypothetical protein
MRMEHIHMHIIMELFKDANAIALSFSVFPAERLYLMFCIITHCSHFVKGGAL